MGSSPRVLIRKPGPSKVAVGAMLLAAIAAAPLSAQPAQTAASQTPEQRLSAEVMRAAIEAISVAPLTTDALDIACTLASEAVALDSESAGLWRLTLKVATLAERDDLRALAIERISRLDPSDDNVRLQRLNMALERYQTVDERAATYERLLSPENVERLGPACASRLALDLALLKQRMGDTDAFSRWLTKALELDRSNRAAAALAAGFFQSNVNDPVGRAELLTNLVMADPTDIKTQVTLAQLLLESGAYTGASRIYELVRNGLKAAHLPATTELMADIAIAQWAAGDVEGSLTTIDRRQADIDEAYRAEQARKDRTLTMLQVGALKGPVDPTLAAVAAVIHAGLRDAQANASLAEAVAAADADIKSATAATDAGGPADAADLASRHLQAAWIALWLGDDAAVAAAHVAEAEKLQPLSDQARQRFDGWQALKAGQVDRAIELLTPLAAADSAARVGLALALERAGRAKDAARELLALNQAQPGSMIGIWAAGELGRILGQRLPLSKQATDLEHLIASISQPFDRYPRDPSMAIDLRVTPQNLNPGPFDPIIVTVQLTNNSFLPLALESDGPLHPQVLVAPGVNSAIPLAVQPKAFVIDLDSRLRLLPRETVTCTFDLRWYGVAETLNLVATSGGIVKLVLDTNFVATQDGSVVPGLLGVEQQAPLLRVDGVRQNKDWLQPALASLTDPVAAPDALMLNIALLCDELTLATLLPDSPLENKELLQQAKTALPAAFGRLDPTRQAWVLTVMHKPAPVEAICDMARKSDSRLVRLAYLIYHVSGAADPMLDAARRGDDPSLKRLAERIAALAAAATATTRPTRPPGASASAPAARPVAAPASMPTTVPANVPGAAPSTAPAVPH